MKWNASELPLIDAGATPPKGARAHALLWPVWILPCDLDELVTSARGLDLFEEAVLALARVGVHKAVDAERATGLHRELVAYVQASLAGQRLLEPSGGLTPTGEAFLSRQLDERADVRRTTAYLVLDAVTGEPLPRVLDRVEPTDGPKRATVVRPMAAFANEPPQCSSGELLEAVRRARGAIGAVSRAMTVHPSERAERCFVVTYAFQRSAKPQRGHEGRGWTIDDDVCVGDPFGLALRSDSQTEAVRQSAASGGWGRTVREQVALGAAGEAAMTAYQAHRAACRVALADRLPVLNTHPKQLQELTTAVGLAEIGVMGSALLALVNVLDETLHKLEQRYSWHEVVARVPEEQSALELHIQEALAECGLETDVPRRTLDAVRKKAAGSVRRSLVSTVLAAADDEHHPLRVLIDLDPGGKPSTWLRDLDILALARNNAGHECDASFAEELARVPFQRFLQMIEQAIEVLLGDLEEVHA